jgi:NAD(P)-dependent dehydrogenase (short-subunit alcohol dehydrogenase family)
MSIKGKRVLVTGASKGLGAVIANHLSSQGAKLTLIARSKDKLEEMIARTTTPSDHDFFAIDLLDQDELTKALDKISNNQYDIIFHCAGGGIGLSDDFLSSEELRKVFDLNVGVAAEINKKLAPKMIESKSGHIVHIGSVAGHQGTASVGYGTIKAALSGYVRSLGKRLAVNDVVVCGIIPGGFYAEENAMWRFETYNPEGYKEFIEATIPNKRMPLAEEFLPMIDLLCGPGASPFASCMIPMDGGQSPSFFTS